jgi:hypothetical protein
MKKTINLILVITAVISMASFSKSTIKDVEGTYSVTPSDPSQIKLILNADNTFYYQDFSNLKEKIMLTGTWLLKGNKVVLTENESKINFHKNWKINVKDESAKSHKGLSFYKLCKIE